MVPVLKGKKVPGFYQKPETKINQTNNTIKLNPEEDISEPSPEEHPEDLSVSNFEVTRITSLPLCPVCDSTVHETTEGSIDPQDTIDYLICPECHWTDREKIFSDMTPEEVLNNLEEVCF